MKNLKERLKAGETVHGCWLSIGSAVSAEIVASAGFDWVLIDLEHGTCTEADLIPQLQAIGRNSAVPLVRIESFETARVKRVLDAGVKGVMFPQIQNANEAREAISNMYYPPKGRRGLAQLIRATDYGSNFDEYFKFAKDSLLGIIQIETKESLNHLDEIASIEGVDVLFLGPADLSISLGIFGQWDHPDYIAAVDAVQKAAEKAGIATGLLILDMDQYDFYYQRGFRCFACAADVAFVTQGAQAIVKQLNERKKHSSEY